MATTMKDIIREFMLDNVTTKDEAISVEDLVEELALELRDHLNLQL